MTWLTDSKIADIVERSPRSITFSVDDVVPCLEMLETERGYVTVSPAEELLAFSHEGVELVADTRDGLYFDEPKFSPPATLKDLQKAQEW